MADKTEAERVAYGLMQAESSGLRGQVQVDHELYERLVAENRALRDRVRVLDIDENVRQFHRAMGQGVRDVPSVPDEKVVRLRARLVTEETLEMLRAMFDVSGAWADSDSAMMYVMQRIQADLKTIIDEAKIDVCMPELADSFADVDYVVAGSRLAFGIDGAPIAAAVHRANLAKADGPVREDGKRGKPPGWQPPDIEGELRKQGWEG
jgi:predicted HAD superfamily Cof-like phosphohydrolase